MHCERPACQHIPNSKVSSELKTKTDLPERFDSGHRQVIQRRSSRDPAAHMSNTQCLLLYAAASASSQTQMFAL